MKIPSILLVLALCATGSACRRQEPETQGGAEILVRGSPSLMTELEADALGYLQELNSVVETNLGNPRAAVERVRAFLNVSGTAMMANARELEARYLALPPEEARVYEAQLNEYLAAERIRWNELAQKLNSEAPAEGRQIVELVELYDD